MAGEIVLAPKPGLAIRKWRESFGVSQRALSRVLEISPSVICDYESGRRQSPGAEKIRGIVDALILIDDRAGGEMQKRYTMPGKPDAILMLREFLSPQTASNFARTIGGKTETRGLLAERDIHGCTVVDSIKAIMSMDSNDYPWLYGWSSERALIFTGVEHGRSPMIAIKAHPLKPAMVVYHKPKRVDQLAIKIAQNENIHLVTTNMELDELMALLQEME